MVIRIVFLFIISQVSLLFWASGQGLSDGYREGKTNAPNQLKIYFSVGCSHCLEYFSQNLSKIKAEVRSGRLSVEFIDVPGFIGDGESKDAHFFSSQGSLFMYCASLSQNFNAFEYLETLQKNTKIVIETRDDWRDGGVSWQNWVHSTSVDFTERVRLNLPHLSDSPPSILILGLMAEHYAMKGDNCIKGESVPSIYDLKDKRRKRLSEIERIGVPAFILNGSEISYFDPEVDLP